MPEKYNAKEMIDALRAAHGNISAASRRLGCSRNTLKRYIDTYATVQDAYEEERETLIDFTENQLFQQVKQGNITAIIFTLKTIGRHRGYVERQEIEHSGELRITPDEWRKQRQERINEANEIMDGESP